MNVRTFVVLFLFLGSFPLAGQSRALAPVFPPLVESADGTHASGGLSVELVLEAARRGGVPLAAKDVDIVPWARALATASITKNVLLFPTARTPEREPLFEWIGPVNRLDYHLYRRKGSAARAITSLADIGSSPVGVFRNDIIQRYLGQRGDVPSVRGVNQLESLVSLVLADRVDYIVTTSRVVQSELAALNRAPDALEALFPVDQFSTDTYSYLVLAKGSNSATVDALRRAFESMRRDGTWEAIYRKYQ